MGLGDGLRALAIQHLASGGSAEELHQELSGLTPPSLLTPTSSVFGPPDAAGNRVGLNSGITTHFADPGYPLAGVPGQAAQNPVRPAQSIASAPAADSMPPAAPSLPAIAQGQPPIAPEPGGPLSRIAMSGPVGGANPYYGPMNQALANSSAAERGELAATDAYGQGLDAEARGKGEELRVRGLQAAAEEPARAEQAQAATQHAERTEALQAQMQQKIDTQMAKYQAATDAAADTQIHNFFENKTTGASIMAIISQALAGAANGLSGNPGAPTPLDRIIQQDLDMQKANIDIKSRNADRQGNMLRTLTEELGSKTQAENAYYAASLDKTEAIIKQLAPHYAGGINSAQAQQALGAVQEKKAMLQAQTQQHIAQTETTKADAFGHAAEGYDNRQMALSMAAAKASNKEQQNFQTRGFNGTIPKASKKTADDLQAKHYALQSAFDNFEQVLKGPNNEENYNKLKSANGAVALAVHNLGFTRPQQLEDMIGKLSPGLKEAATNWLDAGSRYHQERKDYADLYRQGMLGLNPYKKDNPDGLVADYDDPVMGPLWRERDTDRATTTQLQSENR